MSVSLMFTQVNIIFIFAHLAQASVLPSGPFQLTRCARYRSAKSIAGALALAKRTQCSWNHRQRLGSRTIQTSFAARLTESAGNVHGRSVQVTCITDAVSVHGDLA